MTISASPAQASPLAVEPTDPRIPSIAQLHPEDIICYTLQHESIRCRCDARAVHSRMWITYATGRTSKTSRPVGLNEQLYARIPIRETWLNLSTRACVECITTTPRENWTPRPKTDTDRTRSNIPLDLLLPGHIARASNIPRKPEAPLSALLNLLKK